MQRLYLYRSRIRIAPKYHLVDIHHHLRRRGQYLTATVLFHPRRSRHYSATKYSSYNRDKAMTLQPSPSTSITFLTDVEGDGAYLDRFIQHSKILKFRSIKPCFGRYVQGGKECVDRARSPHNGTEWNLGEWEEDYFPYDKEIVFRDGDSDSGTNDNNSMLVYGGDIWDKGGSDLYVIRQLLSLHQRYPNRVHLLMGNRDINKMRIVDELGASDIHIQNESLPSHRGVYWLRNAVCSGLSADPESIVPCETASERCRWMLRKTMGSVDAFELRRKELERERVAIINEIPVPLYNHVEHREDDVDKTAVAVTDDEVAQSYIRSCNPTTGIMGQYLTHAKLVISLGNVLFLHGAFPFVPSSGGDEQSSDFPTPWAHPAEGDTKPGCKSLLEWIDVLNDFASNQVKAWKNYDRHNEKVVSSDVWATEGGYLNTSPGGKLFGALVQYGMGTLPDRSKTQSCVYNSWMDDGLPREDLFGSDDSMRQMSELFARAGIQMIVTGHQPVGDAPWPIQLSHHGEESKFWILPCDTSFSGDTRWTRVAGFDSSESAGLGRGSLKRGRGEVAFSEPLINICEVPQSVVSVEIHGCLSDGTYYETGNIVADHLLIGNKFGEGEFKDKESGDIKKGTFWVKGKAGKHHLVSYGNGFNVWNAYIKIKPG